MKKRISLFVLLLTNPLFATLPAAPTFESVAVAYSQDRAEITRQAVRLGYQNFQLRFNTPQMTDSDQDIFLFITTCFQAFVDKLPNLARVSGAEKQRLHAQYNEEFSDLIAQLSQLLLNNQEHYTNPLFVEDNAARQETVRIVQQALAQGFF